MSVLLQHEFVLNVSGDPGVNLLATIVLTSNVLFLEGHFGRLYRTNAVDKIEMTCYLTVGIFSAIQLLLFKAGIEQIVDVSVYISEMVTFIVLFAAIAYHVFTEFCSKKCKWRESRSNEREEAADDLVDNLPEDSELNEPTFSVLEGPPQWDSAIVKTSKQGHRSSPTHPINETNDDDVSIVSTDSTAPLLDENEY